MKFNLPKKVYLILTIFCLVISLVYRSRFYSRFPLINDSFDEFNYGWLGLSLLNSGIPTSWSFIPDYEKGIVPGSKLDLVGTKLYVDDKEPTLKNYRNFNKPISLTKQFELDGYTSYFKIVSPHLEQTPLGGIIISLPLVLKGAKTFQEASLAILRKPFVFYGVIATYLTIWIARLWHDEKTSLVAGFLYATVPTIVFGSRMALPENLLVILVLLQAICLEYYRRTRRKHLIYFSLFLSYISPLVKPFGLAVSLIGVGYSLLLLKREKIWKYYLLAAFLSILTFVLYGLFFDKNTFLWVLSYQSKRFFAGPTIFLIEILIPKITRIFLDGWIFFGWLSLLFVAFQKEKKKHLPLLISVGAYLFTLIFFGGENYGWYRLPIYPFLLITASVLIRKIIKEAEFFSSVLFLLTAVATSFYWGLGIFDWSQYLNHFRLFLIVSVAILSTGLLSKDQKLYRLRLFFMAAIFIVSIFLNTRAINQAHTIWPLLDDKSSLILDRR